MSSSARRVVFVSQLYPPEKGGNASRIHDMATNLDGTQWDVTVLAPPPCYPPGSFERTWRPVRTEARSGVTVHQLWTWQPQEENPGTVQRLAYYLLFGIHVMLWLLVNIGRYDAVVTTTPPISTGAPGLLASALGKAWLVDVRDRWIDASVALGYLEEGSVLERVSRRFQRLVLTRADHVTVTTPTLAASLRDTYGSSLEEKTAVIPNGVDTDRFRPDLTPDESSALAATATDLQTDGGRPQIIYTGNLGSAQPLDACVRAMAHLRHDAVLTLVGSGDIESDLRALVADLGLEDDVEFRGFVPRAEVPALLGAATVGLAPIQDSPEFAYAMPTKVYEYMGCGLPVLVTGQGEIERFVDASGGGVHASTDPEEIAARLDELLADPDRRQELGDRGRDYIVARYDRRDIAQRFGDVLAAALDGASA